jgi:hypothetical protein
MNRATTDSVFEYMKQWYDFEKPTDFSVAYDKGFDDLCIYYLCSAGAIEGICPESRAMLVRYKKLSHKKVRALMDECFKHCAVMTKDDDETIFVPVDDPEISYFVSIEDWENDGYKFERMFKENSDE